MVRFIIYIGVYLFFIPILTFLHELGHAAFALILTKDQVCIEIGNRNLSIEKKIGRLIFKFKGYKNWVDINFGLTRYKIPKSKAYRIAIVLGGPLSSLAIFLLSILILLFIHNLDFIIKVILRSISIYSLCQFLTTILPINYKFGPYNSLSSDGYKILQILKEK